MTSLYAAAFVALTTLAAGLPLGTWTRSHR